MYPEDMPLQHIAVRFESGYYHNLTVQRILDIKMYRICYNLYFFDLDYSVANMALKNLNGKFLKGRRISVQPSNTNYQPKIDFRKKGSGSKESLKGLSLANSSSSSEVSKEDKIRAIEAKLKALQNGGVNLLIIF